jgi:hypothetical protein
MAFQSRPHSWLCVWLSCLLSVMLSASPVMLSLLPEDARCEETEPADASEEIELTEVTLSESSSAQRRTRLEQAGVRQSLLPALRVGENLLSRCVRRPSAGQVSLWGRCGPLHC